MMSLFDKKYFQETWGNEIRNEGRNEVSQRAALNMYEFYFTSISNPFDFF